MAAPADFSKLECKLVQSLKAEIPDNSPCSFPGRLGGCALLVSGKTRGGVLCSFPGSLIRYCLFCIEALGMAAPADLSKLECKLV